MDSTISIVSLIVGLFGSWLAYKQYFQKPKLVFRFITKLKWPIKEAIGVEFNEDGRSKPIKCRLQLTNIGTKTSSHLQLYLMIMKNISVVEDDLNGNWNSGALDRIFYSKKYVDPHFNLPSNTSFEVGCISLTFQHPVGDDIYIGQVSLKGDFEHRVFSIRYSLNRDAFVYKEHYRWGITDSTREWNYELLNLPPDESDS